MLKMASYKTKLCKHWLKHGNCQLGSKCHYAHGERELERMEYECERMERGHKRIEYENVRMERERNKLVSVNHYYNKHDSIYHQYNKHESKYYNDNDKQKSKYYHQEKSCHTCHASHFPIHNYENDKQYFQNRPLFLRRSYEERVPIASKENFDNDMEDGEFENPKTSPKHSEQVFSPSLSSKRRKTSPKHNKQVFSPSPSPKRRKLSDNKNNKLFDDENIIDNDGILISKLSDNKNAKEFDDDNKFMKKLSDNKYDKVFDDDDKSIVAKVEICEENTQENEGELDLENLLRITPKDDEVNVQNDEDGVQTKLKHCASCKNFENRLHQTSKENEILKNTLYNLEVKYSQMKEAKFNVIENIKNIESFYSKYHNDTQI
jgi:hypothetical protein